MNVEDRAEEKILCPYDPAHHIRRYKMGVHLVKCKKNFPAAKRVECDFNTTHKIPEPELQFHHENCPDRGRIEIACTVEAGVVINKFPVHNIGIQSDECWDDINVPTYDPKIYCEQNEVLRHVDVESAATRKNFRIGERKRINNLTAVPDRPEIRRDTRHFPNPRPVKNWAETEREQNAVTVAEETPKAVISLTDRIKLGVNRSFVAK